jgi:putative PIN family toxin of toxin-antitoxin system
MRRFVVDPGVLIAALLSPRGAPAEIYRRWLLGDLEIVTSPLLLAELERVLERPKFRPYVSLSEARRFVALVRRASVLAEDQPPEGPLSLDPGDDYLVALARGSAVRHLVSGDRHLLDAGLSNPQVLTPRQLVDMLEQVDG